MNRNYENMISEYDNMFKGKSNDAIYVSDLQNIKNNNDDLFGFICNAMKYGYVMGYKAGAKRRKIS